MTTVVDSAKKELSPPEIMTMFTNDNNNNSNLSDDQTMLAIVKELTMPNVDQTQLGNTVFIGHRGKGKNKNAMAGRALNVDTANNFSKNGLEYMEYLRKKGVEYYRTDFYNEGYLSLFRRWHKTLTQRGDDLDVMKLSDGGFRAFIVLKPKGNS